MRIGDTLYFDHQATTPLDPRVWAAMSPYFAESCGNPHSTDHALGWSAARAMEMAAARVGHLIGADPDEIVFTSGATEANNLALLGLARRAREGKRRRVLLGATEHKSVLAIGRALEQQLGFFVETIKVDKWGRVKFDDLIRRLDEDVLIVSIMAVNNEIGTVNDVAGIGKLVKSCGAYFHCDGAQAPLAMDLSGVADLVDMLSLSAHKMYGPKGVGALFVRRELQQQIEPVIYGGGQQNNLRSGTLPTPLCVGMGAAADLMASDVGANERAKLAERRDRFLEGLFGLGWPVRLNGPEPGPGRHPGNANVLFEGVSAHDVLGALQPRLAASTGSACSTGMPEPSHVLRAIGLSEQEAESSVRFSLGWETTDEDVIEAVDLIDHVLAELAELDLTASAAI